MPSVSEKDSMERPPVLISLVIPVYNGLPYISQTIESVRQQTYPHWELLICDNASRDGTGAWVQEFLSEKQDPRMKLITDTQLLPMAENWNRALTYAKGDFIKILPADDILLPQCLELQLGILQKYSEVGFAASGKQVINSAGRVLFNRKPLPEGIYDWQSLGPRSLKAVANLLGEPGSILFRRELLEECGNYDIRLRYYVDIELLWRFLKVSKVYVTAEPLYQFRIHGTSASASSRNPALHEYELILDRYGEELGFAKKPYLKKFQTMKSHLVVFLRDLIFRISNKFY